MDALLRLLHSDSYKQRQLQQRQLHQHQEQQQPPAKKSRTSTSMMLTRANIAMMNRRNSNVSVGGGGGGTDTYDDGNNSGSGGNQSGRTASTREVVFPDSFEVLPQPQDLNVVYMDGVPYEQQRKFRCRFCGKGYRWKSTMRRHEMVECGGKPPAFQCPECPYKARQRGNLTVHFKRHHQKSYEDTA